MAHVKLNFKQADPASLLAPAPTAEEVLRSALTGAVLAAAVAAIVLIAFFALPQLWLPWTFVVATALAALIFVILLYIPYKSDEHYAQLIPDQLQDKSQFDSVAESREAKFAHLKELEALTEEAKEKLADIPRRSAPMAWAKAMDDLGRAYLELAVREKELLGRRSKIATLKQAGSAFRKAIEERTFEKAPQEWALTLLALGQVQLMLGERGESIVHLNNAIDAFTESVKVLPEKEYPKEHAESKEGIEEAHRLLAQIPEEDLATDDGGLI